LSEIPEILINTVSIPELNNYFFSPIQSLPQNPPVTLQIGNPIIEVPGCVVFNPANEKSINLVNEDERGNRVLCDAGTPSYTPIDYQPENLIYVQDAVAPDVQPAPEVDTPEPNLDNIPQNKESPCPAPNQPRVGDLTRNGEEIVVGHELQGTTCVVLYEPSSPTEKLLPNTSQISTTAAIAVVATASAAATPLLLRLIKPLIKQLTKKIKGLFGKKDRERFKGLKRKKKLISESNADD
tara:strand:+ start:76 stop:792 length:717 start_codon:yes stop_codon:yes gene_type:complete